MATETIIIDYKVEVGNLQARLKDVETQLRKTGDAGKKAAKDTSEGIFSVQKASESFNESIKDLGKQLVAAFAVTEIIAFGKESVKAFAEAESGATKLALAISAIGGTAEDIKKLNEQAEILGKTGIFEDDIITQAQTVAAQYGLTVKQIQELTPHVLDFAAATGQDLNSAFEKIIKGSEGMTKGLKIYGVQIQDSGDKGTNLSNIMAQLNEKFQGQNEIIAATTTEGKLTVLTNQWQNFKEAIGEGLVNSINDVIMLFKSLVLVEGSVEEQTKQMADKVFETSGTKDAIAEFQIYIKNLKDINVALKAYQENNLALQEIAKKNNDPVLLKRYQNELDAVLDYKDAYVKSKIEERVAAEKAAQFEKSVTGLTKKQLEERKLIFQDYENRKDELEEQFQNLSNKGILKATAAIEKELQRRNKLEQDAINAKLKAEKEHEDEIKKLKQQTTDYIISLDYKDGLSKDEQMNADMKASKEHAENLNKIEEDIYNKKKDLRDKDAEEEREKKKQIVDASFQIASDSISFLQNLNDIALQNELAMYQSQLDKKEISQEEFDQKQRDAKRKAAEENKQLATFNIILSTAQAVIAALTSVPPNVPLSIASGVAGLLQLAVVQSQPLPQFAKGTDYLKRNGHKAGVDTIPALLNEGEAIIPTDQNNKYPGLSKAWINGNLDKYILQNYVVPAIKEQQNKNNQHKSQSLADNIAKAIIMNQKGFYDGNIVEGLKMQRSLQREQIEILKQLKSSGYNPRTA